MLDRDSAELVAGADQVFARNGRLLVGQSRVAPLKDKLPLNLRLCSWSPNV